MPKQGKYNDRVPLFDRPAELGGEAEVVSGTNRATNSTDPCEWTTIFGPGDHDIELQEVGQSAAHGRQDESLETQEGQHTRERQDTGLSGTRGKGEYSWAWLCTPRLPCSKPSAPPPFFHLQSPISWALAAVMGLQHALAMMGGIVTSPILIAGPDYLRLSKDDVLYLISAGLIISGLTSCIQIRELRWRGIQLGTGLVSVMGTSFTFIPIAQVAASFLMQEESTRPCRWDGDCTDAWAGTSGPYAGVSLAGVTNAGQCSQRGLCKHSGREAYGAFLGTAMAASVLELALSFVPSRVMRRIFPPVVTGVCVLLIGVGLTGTGFRYWGGGAGCADAAAKRKMEFRGPDLPGNFSGAAYPSDSPCSAGACAPPQGKFVGVCQYTPAAYDAQRNLTLGDVTVCEAFSSPPSVAPHISDPAASWVLCGSNGEVTLPFGSPEYLALGASVFGFLLLVEMVGSPFMRNCNLVLALGAGFAIAAAWQYTADDGARLRFVVTDDIASTPSLIFLWFRRFPLSVYPPLIPPMLVCFVITAVETIGDITAAAEASRVANEGEEFGRRIQGGLLADGINSFLACCVFSLPNTTISQNAAVIVLTRCANKRAGYCCCAWLILFGVLAKTAAVINAIPKAVVGGMTTFLFVNVAVSGISILSMDKMDRRRRFILAGALGVGIGVAIVPAWAMNALWTKAEGESKMMGLLRDSTLITLSTPYCVGTLIGLVLNIILPEDTAEEDPPPAEPQAETEGPSPDSDSRHTQNSESEP